MTIKSLLFTLTVPVLPVSAAILVPLPGLTESATWSGLNNGAPNFYNQANGWPIFPTTNNPWPSALAPDPGSSADSAAFNKASGSGYFATSSLYDAGNAGTYRIGDTAPMAGMQTVVFQLDLGTALGVSPVLNVNGGSQALVPDLFLQTAGDYVTFNFLTGQTGPTLLNVWQWDLSSIVEPIESYEILWGSVPDNHLTQYQVDVTTGDAFVAVIPEPSVAAALMVGGALFGLRRRRA